MARNDALQGALPILVLKILARRGPLHGYAITTQIETASDPRSPFAAEVRSTRQLIMERIAQQKTGNRP